MRVAWFHAAPATPADASAFNALRHALRSTCEIAVVTEPDAHAFVVENARRPCDVCVYDLRNEPRSAFIWAYLFHYPGVLLLRDRSLHDVRVRALERDRRTGDYAAEFAFNHGHPPPWTHTGFVHGGWPMLRAALLASRMVVVPNQSRRLALETLWPRLTIRTVPPCAEGPADMTFHGRTAAQGPMTVAVTSSWARDTLDRAARRSHDAGQHVDLLACRYSPDVSVDTVVALDSPAEEPDPTPALSAMAHGRAVIVFEREATAGWPALDPQTWRPRQPLDQRSPIVVSIDPRDQEHSLTLALQGMAGNPGRRQQLGLAARAWWQAHATPQHASAAWVDVLAEAATLAPPALPSDWPAHLRVDGAESLRAVLADMGVDSRPLGSGFAG